MIADYLTRGGIAVLRDDDRGVGGSTGSISESTSADFAEDALAAVEFLRSHAKIAPDRVGLLGHSEGAIVGPMEINRALTAAATRSGDPEAARAAVHDLIMKQNELMPPESRPSGDALGKMVQASVDQLFSPWFQFFLRYDPREALRKVTVPVLALNGTLDLQVVDTQNLPAVESALAETGNKDVTVRSLPGLNHMFQHATTGTVSEYGEIDETISPDVLEIIRQWITTRFGPKE